jgi:hypothetical protein
MNKGVCMAVVLFLCAGIYADEEQGFPLVSGICIMEDEAYQKSLPPGKITIGFDVRADVFYKFSFRDQVVRAGQFQKGFQTISLVSPDFFRKTDKHSVILECKSGDTVVLKEILIDIRLIPLYIVQKGGERKKQRVYTLSFFIGPRMVYSTRKFAPSDISFELELPPWEARYNPFGLIDGGQKPVTGVSILGAVAVLYHLVKSISTAEKTASEDFVPQKKQQIETTFLKTNAAGDLWQWRALISITAKDMKNYP